MRFLSLVPCAVALWALASCAHHEVAQTQAPSVAPYETELDKAFAEAVELDATRSPAQQNPLQMALKDLNKLKPGKFSVFVFPKLTGIAAKNSVSSSKLFKDSADERMSQLGKPMEYEVSILAVNPCQQFMRKNLFKELNAKSYFPEALAQNRTKQCAILEVTSKNMRTADRALIRRDDLLKTRIYLDDSYAVYGYELEKFLNGQDLTTVRVKAGPNQSSASGLTLFPIDIPRLAIMGLGSSTVGEVNVSSEIDALAISQIRNSLQRSFEPVACNGRIAAYKDYYGTRVRVGWCNGIPFPQVMENSRFVAVTQSLNVR